MIKASTEGAENLLEGARVYQRVLGNNALIVIKKEVIVQQRAVDGHYRDA